MATTVSGLSSGIQTDDLIEKLMQVERRPILNYQAQQDQLRARQSAFQAANTRLGAVRDAADALSRVSLFNSRAATISDSTVATVTASTSATPGEYQVSVESIARSHQMLSQSFADTDTTRLGTGTLTFTAGNKTLSVNVDSSNNTLAGLRDAINRSNGSVRASIVQDGDASYRLMVASKETGTANAITLGGSLSGGTAPTLTDLQVATDAQVKLGSGASALTVTRSSNVVQDLIPGVTMSLLKAAPGETLTVSVRQDNEQVKQAVQKLVDQFNNAVSYLNDQFKFDPDSKKGGVLLGDATLRGVQDDLMGLFSSSVAGVENGSLAEVGLTMGGDGKLSFDVAAFEERLNADPAYVSSLFALTSESTNAAISLSAVGKANVDGSSFTVEITQAARQARVTAGTAQSGTLDADEVLTLNGVEINLTAGMTQSQVLAAINARSADTRIRAAATGSDGTGSGTYLTFTSTNYGSGAKVSILSSRSSASGSTTGVGNVAATQASAGGETASGVGEAGLDVLGTINGEAATGEGQILSGNSGNATTDGLKLRITSTTTGALGSIQIQGGVGFAAKRVLDTATDAAGGPLKTEQDSLAERIQDLDKVISDREAAISRREQQLRTKFTAMESALSQYQSQSAYLSSQIASLNR